MENKYLVTTVDSYYWFFDETEMYEFIYALDNKKLKNIEITHIIQAEDIPISNIISDEIKYSEKDRLFFAKLANIIANKGINENTIEQLKECFSEIEDDYNNICKKMKNLKDC
jgi:hypothetical protein